MQGALVGLMNTSNGTGTTAQSARTNVGFFNPNDNPTSVALELRDDNGTVLGNQIVVLAPFQQAQLSLIGASGLFPNVSGDVVTATIFFIAGSPLFTYASIVDNVSGDGSFVLPSKTD